MNERTSAGTTRYFVDFDYTISKADVWDTLVKACNSTRWQSLIEDYVGGRISSRQCNLELAQSLSLSRSEACAIASRIGLDPTFRQFVDWAQERQSPLMILSDGYDFYIDLLLKQEGIASIPVYSNRMVWTEDGIQVEFPLYRPDCERDMAHCKCQHVRSANGYRRVYIGDGVSDTCAAGKCDFVYAKRNLLDYCRERQIQHKSFDHFLEIIEHEEALFQRI